MRGKGKKATCHPDRLLYALGMCRSCYEKDLRDRNPDFAERQKKNRRDWYAENHDYVINRCREYDKKRRESDPDYRWKRALKRKYDISAEDYYTMLELQGGGCAICGRPFDRDKKLHVDHCHETGKVRGLLCYRCNFGMTWFSSDPALLHKCANYLEEEHSGRVP